MKRLSIFWAAFAIAFLAGDTGCTTAPVNSSPAATGTGTPAAAVNGSGSIPEPAALTPGFTLESVTPLAPIVAFVDSLGFRPWVRIVLQADKGKFATMSDYAAAYLALKDRAQLLIEIVDSDFDRDCDTACYASRATEAAAKFPGAVIEAGNEMNGTGWLSKDTAAHFVAAARAAKAGGAKVWLTLYSEDPETYRAWCEKLPADVLPMVDYVGLSQYPADNESHETDLDAFVTYVGSKFPNALIGYGECPDMTCLKRRPKHPRWRGYGMVWTGSQRISRDPKAFKADMESGR